MQTFTHPLFYLTEYPEHAQTLREQIQEITNSKGWTYTAITKMVMKVGILIRGASVSTQSVVVCPYTPLELHSLTSYSKPGSHRP